MHYNLISDTKSPAFMEENMPRPFPADKRSAMLETVSHVLVGLVLVMKGIDKAEHFGRHPKTVIFLFCAGAFIILGAVFLHRIEKKVANFAALFHVAEGLSLVLVGLVLLEKSARMPYFLLFAGAVYVGLGIYEFFTDAAAQRRLRPRLMAVLGTLFLAAAMVFAAFNFFHSRNAWAFIIAGVIAACGFFMLLLRRKIAG
jgi:hypothetical protein